MREQSTRAVLQLMRRLTGAVLFLYLLPALILPLVHLSVEWCESLGCVACTDDAPEPPSGPSLEAACDQTAACQDRSHRHHHHPLHDSSHCTICASHGSALLDRPSDVAALSFEPGRGAPLATLALTPLVAGTRRVEVARGPPST